VSGVSLDEEAASMMRLQRACEANARVFTTVNQTLDVLLNPGR
jgi:flagellar hook-associated protein FlgK